MYTNANTHRFPALVLALGLTTAVVVGLSSLAHSRLGTVSPDSRLVGVESPASALSQASTAPQRTDVLIARS